MSESARNSESALREQAELAVVIVSYNTRALTLKCLDSLYNNTPHLDMRVIVVDNNSKDGSADAVATSFPQVNLVRNIENQGFAAACNQGAAIASAEWLLLLNPDTEVHPDAINNLLSFSREHPEAGITGGRTVFPDGSLNIASCWRKITPWSLFCSLSGFTQIFPNLSLFNPEAMPGYKRDYVKHVDIVVGCLLMIPMQLWLQLGGFNTRYFMYGEESDLCLRAAKLGYRPMITPDAEIMHLVGASTNKRIDRATRVWKSRVTIIREHWSPSLVWLGIFEVYLGCMTRALASWVAKTLTGDRSKGEVWLLLWSQRHDWLKGY